MLDDEKQEVGGTPEPSGQDHRYLGLADVEQRQVDIDKKGFLTVNELAVKSIREDVYYSRESDFMEYRSRPLGQVLGCGFLALLFLSARFWLFPMNDALGKPLGQGLGVVTLILMLAGAYCAFMAWPKYKLREMSDEEHAERVASRENFRRRFRR